MAVRVWVKLHVRNTFRAGEDSVTQRDISFSAAKGETEKCVHVLDEVSWPFR